jgi:hypothetical protein
MTTMVGHTSSCLLSGHSLEEAVGGVRLGHEPDEVLPTVEGVHGRVIKPIHEPCMTQAQSVRRGLNRVSRALVIDIGIDKGSATTCRESISLKNKVCLRAKDR